MASTQILRASQLSTWQSDAEGDTRQARSSGTGGFVRAGNSSFGEAPWNSAKEAGLTLSCKAVKDSHCAGATELQETMRFHASVVSSGHRKGVL